MVIKKQTLELESIAVLILTVAMSLFFVVWKNKHQPQFHVISSLPRQTITPTPSSIPLASLIPADTVTAQTSSDGTKKLSMKVTPNNDKTKTYTFSTADGFGMNEQVVFTKTLTSEKSMLIPFNTWSPDNKYFFIQQQGNEGNDFMVFTSLGTPFANGEAYLDITDVFKAKNTANTISQATGWASQNLIIFNTVKSDSTKGSSYWFEVPSKAIIQLSTEF